MGSPLCFGIDRLTALVYSSLVPRRRAATTVAPKPGYGFADVLVLTDASRSNLIHWTNTQTIEPEIEGTTGRGVHRRFSTYNLIEIQLCATLVKFRLPVGTLRGAVNILRHFHLGALAVEGERRRPAGAAASCLPVFSSAQHQRTVAESFTRSEAITLGIPAPRTAEDVQRAKAHVTRLASVWAELRAGSLIRGEPDPAWSHFVGLFLDGDGRSGAVAIDPPNLQSLISGSAIVIDLADVVWRVGEKFARLAPAGFEGSEAARGSW